MKIGLLGALLLSILAGCGGTVTSGVSTGGGGTGGAAPVPETLLDAGYYGPMAANSEGVYFHGRLPPDEGLLRVDKESGAVALVAESLGASLAVSETDVYGVRAGSACLECPPEPAEIVTVPTTGGPVSTFATLEGYAPEQLAVSGDSLFFTDGTQQGLYRLPLAGGPVETIVPSGVNPYWLVADAGFVAFASPEDEGIRLLDPETQSIVIVATEQPNLHAPRLHDGAVYWGVLAGARTIRRSKIGSGIVEDVVANVADEGYFDVAGAVYFSELGELSGGTYSNGRIVRAPLDGSPISTLLGGLGEPGEVLADATHVYWVERFDLDARLKRVPLD